MDFYSNADPESITVDGDVRALDGGSGETWADLRALAGTSFGQVSDSNTLISVRIEANGSSNKWNKIYRGIMLFDTSAIGGSVVNAATLNIYLNAGATDQLVQNLDVVGVIPASNTGLVVGDWSAFNTVQLGTIAVASLTGSAYNAITLNGSGIAAINGYGITKFGLMLGADRTNTAPTWAASQSSIVSIRSADWGSEQPYLSVTLAAPPALNNSIKIFPTKAIAVGQM